MDYMSFVIGYILGGISFGIMLLVDLHFKR